MIFQNNTVKPISSSIDDLLDKIERRCVEKGGKFAKIAEGRAARIKQEITHER